MVTRLLTYNVNHKARGVTDFMRTHVADAFDIAAFQESEAQTSEIVLGLPGWYGVGLGTPNPLFVNLTNVEVMFEGRLFLTSRTRVLSRGAGPRTMAEKRASVVAVREYGKKRWLWAFNIHATPSIRYPERDEMHEAQVGAVLDFAKRQRGRRVIMGDWNARWSHENLDVLRNAGGVQYGPEGGTHGGDNSKHRIDYFVGFGVFAQEDAGKIPGLIEDDHDAAWVHLR